MQGFPTGPSTVGRHRIRFSVAGRLHGVKIDERSRPTLGDDNIALATASAHVDPAHVEPFTFLASFGRESRCCNTVSWTGLPSGRAVTAHLIARSLTGKRLTATLWSLFRERCQINLLIDGISFR